MDQSSNNPQLQLHPVTKRRYLQMDQRSVEMETASFGTMSQISQSKKPRLGDSPPFIENVDSIVMANNR